MNSQDSNKKMKLYTTAWDEKQMAVDTHEYVDASPISPICEVSDEPRQEYNPFRQPKLWWKHEYKSWRFYTLIYGGLALLVTFIVLVATIGAIAAHGIDANGRITLYTGACSGSYKWSNFFAHLFISGLGTYMLSASAYVMVSFIPQLERSDMYSTAFHHRADRRSTKRMLKGAG
jgi:hypothetical protein